MHTCPVCGFAALSDRPEPGVVCPCCATEFGYDDEDASTSELRRRWVADGARWWSPDEPAPPGWSAAEQLQNFGYPLTPAERASIEARLGRR